MRNPIIALLDLLHARVLKMRAALVIKVIDQGLSVREVAEATDLSEEDVERILWWHRTELGEVNGGWLS